MSFFGLGSKRKKKRSLIFLAIDHTVSRLSEILVFLPPIIFPASAAEETLHLHPLLLHLTTASSTALPLLFCPLLINPTLLFYWGFLPIPHDCISYCCIFEQHQWYQFHDFSQMRHTILICLTVYFLSNTSRVNWHYLG